MSMSELVLNIEELEELSDEMVDPAILNELLQKCPIDHKIPLLVKTLLKQSKQNHSCRQPEVADNINSDELEGNKLPLKAQTDRVGKGKSENQQIRSNELLQALNTYFRK